MSPEQMYLDGDGRPRPLERVADDPQPPRPRRRLTMRGVNRFVNNAATVTAYPLAAAVLLVLHTRVHLVWLPLLAVLCVSAAACQLCVFLAGRREADVSYRRSFRAILLAMIDVWTDSTALFVVAVCMVQLPVSSGAGRPDVLYALMFMFAALTYDFVRFLRLWHRRTWRFPRGDR